MPTLYENEKDEIYTQLASVTGIGKVYKSRRFTADWPAFLAKFKDANGKINVWWFWREGGADNVEGGIGWSDERDLIEQVEEIDVWNIEGFYGFQDHDTTPSELAFQNLVDAVRDKFRFLQDLNGKADKSWPLQLLGSGLWQFLGGGPLCHRALLQLRIRRMIVNPNAEE